MLSLSFAERGHARSCADRLLEGVQSGACFVCETCVTGMISSEFYAQIRCSPFMPSERSMPSSSAPPNPTMCSERSCQRRLQTVCR
jgi:hypothetical protein